MTDFKPIKIKNSSIRLPDDFLDSLLLNDGDYLLIVEENGRYYLRKTRRRTDTPDAETPPKTFEELLGDSKGKPSIDAIKGMNPNDLMKMMEDTLKDPQLRDLVEKTAKGIFKAFSFPSSDSANAEEEDEAKKTTNKSGKNKSENTDEDDPEEDDENSGVNINID